MKIIYPQISKLSQLEIDADKDWGGHQITNLGMLQIVKDSTSVLEPLLELRTKTDAGYYLPIVSKKEDGSNVAIIRANRWGGLALSPLGRYSAGWSDLAALPIWRTSDMPWEIPLRRVMLINSIIFGG